MPKFFIKLVLVFFGLFINSPKAAEQVTIQMLLEKGIVIIETYPSKAPKTVKRITELINQGFYDGLTFHRVISGFMAQGGDPEVTVQVEVEKILLLSLMISNMKEELCQWHVVMILILRIVNFLYVMILILFLMVNIQHGVRLLKV